MLEYSGLINPASTKFGYGTAYELNGKSYIKLNVQICC
ncbi:hypothetical protein [Olivibacter sitiensis]